MTVSQTLTRPPILEQIPKHGMLFLSGYGLRLQVQHGHLCASWGVGRDRHNIRLSRVNRDLKRVIVLGSSGFATFDAIRLVADIGASLIFLDGRGKLLFASTPTAPSNVRLRRAQCLALDNEAALNISRELIAQKISGQGAILREMLGNRVAADAIVRFRAELAETLNIDARGVVGDRWDEGTTEILTQVACAKLNVEAPVCYPGESPCVQAALDAGLPLADLEAAYLNGGAKEKVADWVDKNCKENWAAVKGYMQAKNWTAARRLGQETAGRARPRQGACARRASSRPGSAAWRERSSRRAAGCSARSSTRAGREADPTPDPEAVLRIARDELRGARERRGRGGPAPRAALAGRRAEGGSPRRRDVRPRPLDPRRVGGRRGGAGARAGSAGGGGGARRGARRAGSAGRRSVPARLGEAVMDALYAVEREAMSVRLARSAADGSAGPSVF